MPNFCSAYGCANKSNNPKCIAQKISFHNFPLKKPEILKQWLLKMKRSDDFKPNKFNKLCSLHFTEEDFVYQPFTNRRQLKPDCVPSVFNFLKPCRNRKKAAYSARNPRPFMKKNGKTCFVPGCNTGYRSAPKEKISIFHAPSTPRLLEKWRRNIARLDKELDDTCVVCELHFDEKYIERFFHHHINGENIKIPRDRPHLKYGAVPTIFPRMPKKMSKLTRKRRATGELCKEMLVSKQKHPVSKVSGCQDTERDAAPSTFDEFENCELPSKYWSRQLFLENPNVIAFSLNLLNGSTLHSEKLVLVHSVPLSTISIEIYLRDMKYNTFNNIINGKQFEDLLQQIDKIHLCSGLGNVNEFSEVSPDDVFDFGGKLYSLDCSRISTKPHQCLMCRRASVSELKRLKRNCEFEVGSSKLENKVE